MRVVNNSVDNCYWSSILVYYNHGNVNIANNTLSNNAHHGIGVEHSSLVIIEGNDISGNKERGIHILDSAGINIANNTIHNNIRNLD